uniref:Uncharacterized protein n=1 Tax=Oncorhynchus tshawytscha TaxID=74940 RepID=A0AAZ3SW96_ONCTS
MWRWTLGKWGGGSGLPSWVTELSPTTTARPECLTAKGSHCLAETHYSSLIYDRRMVGKKRSGRTNPKDYITQFIQFQRSRISMESLLFWK